MQFTCFEEEGQSTAIRHEDDDDSDEEQGGTPSLPLSPFSLSIRHSDISDQRCWEDGRISDRIASSSIVDRMNIENDWRLKTMEWISRENSQ